MAMERAHRDFFRQYKYNIQDYEFLACCLQDVLLKGILRLHVNIHHYFIRTIYLSASCDQVITETVDTPTLLHASSWNVLQDIYQAAVSKPMTVRAVP